MTRLGETSSQCAGRTASWLTERSASASVVALPEPGVLTFQFKLFILF